MDDLFGIPMDYIMYALLALLAVALGSVLFVAVRYPIMFKMGLRNIPRRRAQTVLIVIGLMLSTVIISAAFTTGDTVDRSITSEVYSVLGSLDEVVEPGSVDDEAFEGPNAALAARSFDAATVQPLLSALAASEDVDFVIPAYSNVAVAVNPQRRLSSPLFNVVGLDLSAARGLPDIESLDGERLSLDALGPGEMYVNKSAAEELDLQAGDRFQVIAFGQTYDFSVKAIVKDRRLAGAGGLSMRREGGVVALETAQRLFQEPGRLTMLAVSNRGDARGGAHLSDKVEALIDAQLPAVNQPGAPALDVNPVKEIGVNIAESGANLLTTFFLVFGLFSIGAGILLIFLIFVMLAAERKPEMGMARAVGLKRADLVRAFMSEGMVYNMLSALVGVTLGVVVAFIVSQVMAGIFAEADINISPHVTARSLIISYSLGVVITFLTVTFSSWRVSQLNIVRAIRDIPEPPVARPQWRAKGFLSTLARLVFRPGRLRSWLLRLGLLVLAIFLQLSAVGAGSTLLQVLLGIAGGVLFAFALFRIFQLGFVFAVGSLPLIILGASENAAFPLLLGLSLLPLGLALSARTFGANERLTYTLTGLVMLYIWEFDFSVGLLERIFGEADGDIEMFFLSGVMITVAATFVIVYNADLILGVLTRLGRGLGGLLPSLKMAVAYPLNNRSRTGMTMAMFCLVVFALTVMSSMNHNFNRLFLSDRSLGGWDIVVTENPNNPVADLRGALRQAGSPVVDEIEAVGVVSIVPSSQALACEVTAPSTCDPARRRDYRDYSVWGVDASFIENNEIHFQTRARGYASDEAVWQALARDPNLAVVDANAITGGGFGFSGFLESVDAGATTMEAPQVRILDPATGRSTTVAIIGIIETGASNTYIGLMVSQSRFEEVFERADSRRFYVKTAQGTDNVEAAREIESALLLTGAQADSLRKLADDQSATFRSFFYLLQGFMGLGLIVGVAAVGVIAFRTVVERRQQIGMLRAIGYTRGMVGLTFLIESSFIALLGVLSGIVFALILARQLITDEFANQGVSSFSVPVENILVIGVAAFGFALLMTLIPSRQAANVPIAEALRYE